MSNQENVSVEATLEGNIRAQKGLVMACKGYVHKIVPQRTAAQLWKVQSESKDFLYSVIQRATGETTCDCEDFKNRGHIETCKHIWAVVYSETVFDSKEEVEKALKHAIKEAEEEFNP